MRFYFLPLFLFSTQVFSQSCDGQTLLTASYPLNCDSLTISQDVDLTNITSPIIINVQNDVLIKASIKLSGSQGSLLSVDGSGGAGGPGASAGGGAFFLEGTDAPEVPYGGLKGGYDVGAGCGDGASGGGLYVSGKDGTPCTSSTQPASAGGDAFDLTNIESSLRGGFGGGAGGGTEIPIPSGGGGGGAIYINSLAKITVTTSGAIYANGAQGANSNNKNGGGGGGSGGVIILQGNILDIWGTLSATGGGGGTSSYRGSGGAGSAGLIRLKTPQGDQDIIGLKTPHQGADLHSNISCGMIQENKKENQNFLLQVLIPMFSLMLLNFKKRFPFLASK